MNVLDLFSGIGGFSLGLERAGMRTVAFCEVDPFCRAVLRKHWPSVPCYPDVRELTGVKLRADGIAVDVVCGGWPCQDISVAGKGAGLDGERSGLWSEVARLVGELRPRYVILENVAALLGRGMGRVLGDLAGLGYDAEWRRIRASDIGAPHIRSRIWIVAYPDRGRLRDEQQRMPGGRPGGVCDEGQAKPRDDGAAEPMADADSGRWEGERQQKHGEQQGASGREPDGCSKAGRRSRQDVANTAMFGRTRLTHARAGREPASAGEEAQGRRPAWNGAPARSCDVAIPGRSRLEIGPGTLREWAHAATTGNGWWAVEPDVGRVVDGLSDKMDRRKRLIALGNAVVPQIPEIIGRAIMSTAQIRV